MSMLNPNTEPKLPPPDPEPDFPRPEPEPDIPDRPNEPPIPLPVYASSEQTSEQSPQLAHFEERFRAATARGAGGAC